MLISELAKNNQHGEGNVSPTSTGGGGVAASTSPPPATEWCSSSSFHLLLPVVNIDLAFVLRPTLKCTGTCWIRRSIRRMRTSHSSRNSGCLCPIFCVRGRLGLFPILHALFTFGSRTAKVEIGSPWDFLLLLTNHNYILVEWFQ